MMRATAFAPGEHYHVFGRGNVKQRLFHDTRDYIRFLFLSLYFQSDLPVYNVGRNVTTYQKQGRFSTSKKTIEDIQKARTVQLEAFTLMPNHFHMILVEAAREFVETSGAKEELYVEAIEPSIEPSNQPTDAD